MKTSECDKCERRFETLEKGLCYYCYIDVYKSIPTTGVYKMEKKEK